MQIYNQIQQARPGQTRSAVALGYFDGLHCGHEAVIRRAVGYAKEQLCPAVFTFTMEKIHPKQKQLGSLLLTDADKYALLESWGVQLVLVPEFSAFQKMDAETFVEEILVHCLNAEVVCCGADFRFGKNAAAGVSELERLCAVHGIRTELVSEVQVDGERVSSTRIRALLKEGAVERANQLLGRAFGYRFEVVHGKQLGRTIDSPTINQPFPQGFVPLRYGVYASICFVEGVWQPAVTNIGIRPTVEQTDAVNSETYIVGFSGDLYGQKVEVRLLRFLRPEQRFPNVEALKARIQANARTSALIAQEYLKKHSL
ncbi:MAG: riboflavin biosynthesis protein RibF [Anaerotruncus sp.]|nr:riboflavin biosynthesis protein RibF [Anaerotruncus sp.]